MQDKCTLTLAPKTQTATANGRQESRKGGIETIESLGRGLSSSFLAILASIAMMIVVVFYSSNKIDVIANSKSTEQVQRLLEIELDKLAAISLEYGWWNEAVQMVVYDKNIEWTDENVGMYLEKRYGASWILAFDRNGDLVYGRHAGELRKSLPDELISPGLKILVDKSLDTDFSDPQPAAGVINIDGMPALAAAMSFAVYKPTSLELNRSHGTLILIRMFDSELLTSWSENFQIEDLAFSPASDSDTGIQEANSLAVHTVAGEKLGNVRWSVESDGKKFLSFVLPWVLAAGALIILFSLAFHFKLKRYSKVAVGHFVELESSKSALLHQANYDFLTGLANRSLFLEVVSREMARCIRHNSKAAVIYMDLDGFKSVNDTLGHAIGDDLLCLVSECLRHVVRQEDMVARFGGDEFCILLTNIGKENDVERIVRKILDIFSCPLSVHGHRVSVGASAGIVMIPDDAQDCSSIFRFSDIAMYEAKSKDGNTFCFYSHELDAIYKYRARLKEQLSTAIEKGELYLNYQPIYRLCDRRIAGMEALLRWKSEALGEVPPAEFIPFAEESNLIERIGIWVFEQACIDLEKITRETGADITISINVSAKQLRDSGFTSKIDRILQQHVVDTSRIKLEVTESLLITENDVAHNVLLELSDRGYKLVLDDFGTGYSALGYLQRYPLETVKIDKSFVSTALTPNYPLVKTIVHMAQNMGMTTVAEGIETSEQEEFLLTIGCTYGQGFHFSRPVELDRIISLINTSKSVLPHLV